MATAAADGALSLGALFGRYKDWRSVESPPTDAPLDGEPAPDVPAADGALVVQFEATGKEDLRVGFSPPGKPQWRYELALGFSGNTEVTVRKYVASSAGGGKEIALANVFCGRSMSDERFVPYWIVVQHGAIAAGIGQQIGVDPLVRCTDPKDPAAVCQVAFTTWNQGATVRNVRLEQLPADAPLPVDQWTPRLIVRGDPYGDEDLLLPDQRAQYERECEVVERRVARFGGELIMPDLKKFLDPKVIRRLQRTGAAAERGFTTGFDMASEGETAKREARMKRFDTPQFAVAFSTEAARALAEGVTQEEWAAREAEKLKLRERALKFGLDPDVDPKAGAMDLTPSSRKVRDERCDVKTDTMVEFRDDAIHVYSLDERFQQVRTNDIMAYFTGYGPWYVEWINDSSCTVVFEDAGTAGRALIALGDEVPMQTIKQSKQLAGDSEDAAAVAATNNEADGDVDMDGELNPDASGGDSVATATESSETPDESFNRSQWRYGKTIGSSTQPASKTWRLLLRRATADDFPPEKNKKYHERRTHQRAPQQRGRGHRDTHSSRSHPYGGGGGRNRRGDDSEDARPRGGRRRGRGNRDGDQSNSNTSDGLGLLGDFQMPSRGSSRKVTEVPMDD
jgi:hypothetical protein